MTRRLVYTAMFGNYDFVLPPMAQTSDCEFHIFTDDAALQVDGWHTHIVDLSQFISGKHANLHFKSCVFDELPDFDISLYVDANVRILGPLDHLFTQFEQSGAGIGVYRHPLRNSVEEEVNHCLFVAGKVADCPELHDQIAYQKEQGFKDDVGLIEATIIFKNHNDPSLVVAMRMWESGFNRFGTRDQFGLPFVLWKAGTNIWYQDHNFREPNPYFGLYPHLTNDVNPRYVYVAAHAYERPLFKLMLEAWHIRWRLKRGWRRLLGKGVA